MRLYIGVNYTNYGECWKIEIPDDALPENASEEEIVAYLNSGGDFEYIKDVNQWNEGVTFFDPEVC
jgi:hypothetical protein